MSAPPFWAKLTPAGEPFGFHPLVCHLIDVGVVAGRLWDRVLPECLRQDLADGLGVGQDPAGRWLVLLASLHDIGKLSPVFQFLDGAQPLHRSLHAWGGPPPRQGRLPHGIVTSLTLKSWFAGPLWGLTPAMALDLAAVSGGHHGLLPTADELSPGRAPAELAGRLPWSAAREDLAARLAELLDCRSLARPPRLTAPVALWLAGCISVADWIASDPDNFPYACPSGSALDVPDLDDYVDSVQSCADRALERLGWLSWRREPTRPPAFAESFPNLGEPRPLQVAVDAAGRTLSGSRPRLWIVEAPTGEGKTEAALHLAAAWEAASGRRGFYVALPTQATSNQMFARVRAFLEDRGSDGLTQLHLLHGHASLWAEFEVLRQRSSVEPTSVGIDDGTTQTVIASSWFVQKKRGLLATVGVGTIDQVLMAVLRARHVFVRLFGLARRVVIVDEVHAYDAYMSVLLDRLLEWLASLGCPVVLLSATLPTARRVALLEAYGRGAGTEARATETTAYPRLTTLTPDGGHGIVKSQLFAASVLNRRSLRLRWLDGTNDPGAALLEYIRNATVESGCGVIICNTVGRAQEVYLRLVEALRVDEEDIVPLLIHARMPFDARAHRETELLRAFGRTGRRPRRAIVVATQVLEQSLDIDFDAMCSEMAPVDLLLQRAGRLHRHQRERPAHTGEPLLAVVGPSVGDDGAPTFPGGTEYVYERLVLLRTWLALRSRPAIGVPDDIQSLIDLVYDEGSEGLDGEPEPLRAAVAASRASHEQSRLRERREAEIRCIGRPSSTQAVARLTSGALDDDDPELHPALRALTRLAPPSITAVCLRAEADRELVESCRHRSVTRETTRRLLGRSLSIQRPSLVRILVGQQLPAAWRRSPWLRDARLLVFDNGGRLRIGGEQLSLDPDLGLVYGGRHE